MLRILLAHFRLCVFKAEGLLIAKRFKILEKLYTSKTFLKVAGGTMHTPHPIPLVLSYRNHQKSVGGGGGDLAKLTIFRYWGDDLAKLIIFRYLGGCKLATQLLASPVIGLYQSFCPVVHPGFGKGEGA